MQLLTEGVDYRSGIIIVPYCKTCRKSCQLTVYMPGFTSCRGHRRPPSSYIDLTITTMLGVLSGTTGPSLIKSGVSNQFDTRLVTPNVIHFTGATIYVLD